MFTKDNRTETFLNAMGVEFRYTNKATFGKLKPGWNLENIARPVPVRDDAVLEYFALMETGSPAPAPILLDLPDYFDVLDGVQRLCAEQLTDSTQFSAYIVKCDSEDLVAAINVLANARLQGNAEPAEWTRKRAVEVLVVGRGMSVAEVARMGGWRPAEIEATARRLSWGVTIESIGGPTMADNMIDTLSRNTSQGELTTAPEPIAGFLNTIKVAKFSNGDATPYIEEFFKTVTKKKKRHETYTARLEEFRAQPEVTTRITGRKGGQLPRDKNLHRALSTADGIVDGFIESGEPLTYIDEFFKMLKTLDTKLHALAKRHQKAVKPRVPADKWSKDA
jgi:hypothetical protein